MPQISAQPIRWVRAIVLGLLGTLPAIAAPNPEEAEEAAPLPATRTAGLSRGDVMEYGSLLSYSICTPISPAEATGRDKGHDFHVPDDFDALVNKGITLRLG